jgi:dTDP-4-dehydrorhamnose reductase
MPRALVFGSTGQVARELARATWPEGMEPVFLDRHAADLARPDDLRGVVTEHRPDIVIIAAGYTDVERAEDDEETATLVNAAGPAAISSAAADLLAPIVYLSTDFVFDGRKGSPYVEADEANPVNAYGRSKLAGEEAVRAANPKHLILRTSWVYSPFGRNFLRTMLMLAATNEEVSVVSDQRGCPTAAGDLAAAVASVASRLLGSGVRWGTFHLAGGTATSRHEFAEAMFRELAEGGRTRPRLHAVPTASFPARARRPPDSRLSSDAFAREFGVRLRGFEEALPSVLREALDVMAEGEAT